MNRSTDCPQCSGLGINTVNCRTCGGTGQRTSKSVDLTYAEPISPVDCRHTGSLLVESVRVSGPGIHQSEDVTICPHCGTFVVTGYRDGVTFRVAFQLATSEQLDAAMQYVRHIEQDA